MLHGGGARAWVPTASRFHTEFAKTICTSMRDRGVVKLIVILKILQTYAMKPANGSGLQLGGTVTPTPFNKAL